MKKGGTFWIKWLPKIMFFVILILLVAHLLGVEYITVDNTTIILLILLILAPFASSLKKLKYGEFEAEIEPSEVKKVEKEVEKLPKKEEEPKPFVQVDIIKDEISAVLETDHILALAKLRIELEKVLNKMLAAHKKGVCRKMGAGQALRSLSQENLIDPAYISSLKEVINLCNRAIHGEEIRIKDAHSVVDIGFELLGRLYVDYIDLVFKPIKKTVISGKLRDEYADSKYEVTTVIPYVEKPCMNKYLFTQEELDNFLEAYDECAEFLIELKKAKRKK